MDDREGILLRPHQAQEWEECCNERNYRKHKVYRQMGWYHPHDLTRTIALSDYLFAIHPRGGPIALARNPLVIAEVRDANDGNFVTIYSPAGYKMGSFKWTGGRIAALLWAADEHLVVVQDDGACQVHSLQGKVVKVIAATRDLKVGGVKQVIVSQDGQHIVFLTHDAKIVALSEFLGSREPFFEELGPIEDLREGEDIASIAIHSSYPYLEVVASVSGSLFLVSTEAELVADVPSPDAGTGVKGASLAVSWDGKQVAHFYQGRLYLYRNNVRDCFQTINFETNLLPTQLAFCGSNAAIVYWDREKTQSTQDKMFVVPDTADGIEDVVKYAYFERILIAPEVDGARIISDEEHEFLEEVPREAIRTFKYATNNESLLYLARIYYDKRDPRCDELLRTIAHNGDGAMQEAVNSLLTVSFMEWDSRLIRALLKAARFGMDFDEKISTEDFVQVCQKMRILKHLRDNLIAIPMSMKQYDAGDLKDVVRRLIGRGVFWLAHEICEFMGGHDQQATAEVLVHWATSVVDGSLPDERKGHMIIDKLQMIRGIDYVKIARHAREQNKHALAVELLLQEPRAQEMVAELLDMGEDDLALEQALKSGDTDLVFFVIAKLKTKVSTFSRIIMNYPEAKDLYIQYLRATDPLELTAFYEAHDMHHEHGNLAIQTAYKESTSIVQLRSALIRIRDETFKPLKTEKKALFQSIDEEIALLEFQQQHAKSGLILDGLSVSATLFKILQLPLESEADAMRKKFKIPEKRFWRIKVSALARARHWDHLAKFAKHKSPIGYAPFVQACLTMDNAEEAQRYIDKLPKEERVPYLLKTGQYEVAIETAIALKDPQFLEVIEDYGKTQGKKDLLMMLRQYTS